MTRGDFLAHYARALRETQAQLLHHTPFVYPNGDMIRVRTRVGPYLDPICLVWYHLKGEVRSILDHQQIATTLGLSETEALSCAAAADQSLDVLEDPLERQWRRELVTVMEWWILQSKIRLPEPRQTPGLSP